VEIHNDHTTGYVFFYEGWLRQLALIEAPSNPSGFLRVSMARPEC
jgi:hypothetical protein